MDEQIAIAAAKDFCEAEKIQIHSLSGNPQQFTKEGLFDFMVKFLQSMIENEELYDRDSMQKAVELTGGALRREIKRLKDLNVPQWISVMNTPKDGKYLGALQDISTKEYFIKDIQYSYGRFKFPYDPANRIIVTHWMPLPAAPEESTVSSAGKEVKTLQNLSDKDISDKLTALYGDHHTIPGYKSDGFMDCINWLRQFKSSPASTEISNEDFRTFVKENGLSLKWYEFVEKLNSK